MNSKAGKRKPKEPTARSKLSSKEEVSSKEPRKRRGKFRGGILNK